jgi:hypothetical protein
MLIRAASLHPLRRVLRCKSVLQALIVTAPDNPRLVRLRACIYCRLLASKQLSAVFHRYLQRLRMPLQKTNKEGQQLLRSQQAYQTA